MRILHTADTHLGTRQYGLEARRQDFAAAFFQVVEAALAGRVAAVVHAGDLFNDRTPAMEDLNALIQALSRLRGAGIPFLGVVGNHEGKRGLQWLDLLAHLDLAVHLSPDEPYELEGVPVWGVDFLGRRAEEVRPPRVEGGVLVMHQLLSLYPEGELELKDLFRCGAELVLLGDYHEHQVWREGGVLVSYAGSTERWSAREKSRRGCTIFELESLSLERVELNTRRFLYLKADRDPMQELEAYGAQLKGAVVVIEVDHARYTPRQLEEEGLRRGALCVRVRRGAVAEGEQPAFLIEQMTNVEQLDTVVEEALGAAELSPPAREIDHIVRDRAVPDSRVDERVGQLLEEAGL